MTQKQFQKHKWKVDEKVYVVVYEDLTKFIYPKSVEEATISTIITKIVQQSKEMQERLFIGKNGAAINISDLEFYVHYKDGEAVDTSCNPTSFSSINCEAVFTTKAQAEKCLARAKKSNCDNICYFGERIIQQAEDKIAYLNSKLERFKELYEHCKTVQEL